MPDALWSSPAQARDAISARAREVGFDLVGFARAQPLEREGADLRAWLADGRHGQMAYMADTAQRRADPTAVIAGCRSIVAVAINYHVADDADRHDPPPTGRVARYARGRDYHRVVQKPLRKVARFIDQHSPSGTESKPYTDTGPVMERPWAARAGLGFLGKNTLLINRERGSWFLLSVILTTADLSSDLPAVDTAALTDGCGDCRRCIDACPTGALDEPWRIDARRCVSYLTIEHQGAIAPDLAAQLRGNVFGCDICQDVCPYNRKRAVPVAAADDPLAPRLLPADWSLAAVAAITYEQLIGEYAQSALRRAGVESLHRNAAIAAGERKRTESSKEESP